MSRQRSRVGTGLAIEGESFSGAAYDGKVTEHVGEENTSGAGAAAVDITFVF